MENILIDIPYNRKYYNIPLIIALIVENHTL